MSICVIDSASSMRRCLEADDRPAAIRELWAPLAPMYQFMPGGVDLVDAHRQNFGFPVEASPADEDLHAALDALEAGQAWERVHAAVDHGIAALVEADPKLHVPEMNVLLLLGDPTNPHFSDELQGLSGFGGISGYIVITVWPHARVLERLEAIVVHELHHNLRYSPGGIVWDPMNVTLGEQVVSEGLADVFATELYDDRGPTHFVADSTRSDHEVLAKVAGALELTGMPNFPAWILGDATARQFGGTPVGVPTGAGYAAGARLVQAYLEAKGTTAAKSLRTPSAEILQVALPELGLQIPQAD